jgi:hypothetical protein
MVPLAHGLRYAAAIGGTPSISARAKRSFLPKVRSVKLIVNTGVHQMLNIN